MSSNIDRYKKDLDALIEQGQQLVYALAYESVPGYFEKLFTKLEPEEQKQWVADLPSFKQAYQSWYSEAKAVVRQLLPDRLDDFIRHYEKPKTRKQISFENYRIEDALQGLTTSRLGEVIAQPSGALPHIVQQLAILKSVKKRFDSSLFDIRQLVTADVFDSELEAASMLAKNGFLRAAGAIAGVVLEKHLALVCEQHHLKVQKKNPTINDYNDVLKSAEVVHTPQWRFIQHLADIRNLCDHDKKSEPTAEQIGDLLTGVAKISKTLF